MHLTLLPGRRFAAALTSAAVVSSVLAGLAFQTPAAAAATPPPGVSPIVQRPASNVTADALPTTQIDGVVWSQAVVGDTVYAGGEFTSARPAGAAPGTQLTTRNNLLAYSISTGNLVTSFAPSVNAAVLSVAVSPDKSRVYVGGSFTQADGANRYRIAAYSTATGALITSFAPTLDATVNSISVSDTAVFVGGAFSKANGVARSRLAAFSPTNGALLSWAPSANAAVKAVLVVPDQSRVIVGGSFTQINGGAAYGLGAIDPTGALVPWAANQVVQDAGTSSSIMDLSTDGKAVYTSAYVYGSGGNFEGTMSADPNTGTINWLADCHGDTYGAFATGGTVYSASHAHFCSNIGGWPDTNPRNRWYRATAFTTDATGTVLPNGQAGGGYGNFAGQPSPSIINWTPDLTAGTYTKQIQAAWDVTGNSQYVVMGGEFPKANGVAQQGLVRFAIPSLAPKKQGPMLSAAAMNTKVLPLSGNSVRVTWSSNYDRDDMNLTYTLTRNNVAIYTTTTASLGWAPTTMGYIDNTTSPNTNYTYRVRVADGDGNAPAGNNVTVTTPAGTGTGNGAYATDVLNAGATHFWRLDESAGVTTDYDRAGFDDTTLNTGVTANAPGAINDGDTASTFDGSTSGFAANSTAVPGPNTFSESAWFSTTTTAGGKIVGFGDQRTGNSGNYDRHLYMDTSGRINFGVYNNAGYVITSPKAYNDGQYHQVVGTLDSSGMKLFIDGRLVGTNGGTTIGQPYNGYWRIGGDSSWSGSNYFAGAIDDVAIYPTALTLAQIRQQYTDSGRTIDGGTAPTDSYGNTVWNDSPDFYYRMDETAGTTAADRSGNANAGVYSGGVTLGTPSPVSGGTGSAATFDGNSGTLASGQQVNGPSTYSEEVWFNTTSTSGGKLIGFGNQQSGNSGSYDRHVYMLSSGQLVFGTYTGALNLATSAGSYNDGKWHQVVATQGANGMILYVDGQSVATNPQTQAQPYSGYWRIGGDNLGGWNANGYYFNGSLDEASVYPVVLTPAQVKAHYTASAASVNTPPVATFTNANSAATVQYDGTSSSDADGSIVGYAWTFGDGSSSTDAAPSHTYAASGTYTVSLTVTDNRGATATTSRSVVVTIPVNQPPTAAFTATPTNLSVAFDGSASSDSDGTVAGYSWDFGDGSSANTVTPVHAYSQPGDYQVTLTVTDDGGKTGSLTKTVTASLPPNQPPTAAFTATPTNLSVAFDGSASSDPDGTIAGYAWDFGDGASATGATTGHAYSAAGSYPVTLTVTDNGGKTATSTKTVTVAAPVNQAPSAGFTFSPNALSVAFDGTSSVDPDGTVTGYAWDFGDSTSGTSATPTHVYAAGGTYQVTLTVTDNGGKTATVTKSVTVSSVLAADAFGRTLTGSWGAADTGGSWTLSNGASAFSVANGKGSVKASAVSVSATAMLNSVSAQNVNQTVDIAVDKDGTGAGTYAILLARKVANNDYRLKVRLLPNGVVHLAWSKVVAGKETVGAEVNVKNVTYVPGGVVQVRFQVTGNGTTTAINAKAWNAGTAEPAAWTLAATDSEATLQGAGAVGLLTTLGSTATNAPVTVSYDNYTVRSA